MNVRVDSSILLPRTQLLIGGEWGEAASRKRFVTINPATEETITEVSEATAADIDAAVIAAKQALKRGPWPVMTGAQRGRILNRLAAIIRERAEELVLLESLDGGKPVSATRRMDLPAAIDCLEYYAGWADKIAGEVVPTRRDALTFVQRVPVGVVAVIVPWNFALMNAVWKIAPALACGCTVVLKPAELTPLSALWLGAAALEAGLPPGVLNIVPGYGAEAGTALVSHPNVDKISFTGSPQTGQFIMRAAAENITRIGLELGGKRALRMGDPRDAATNLGPVISAKQMERVLGYIRVGQGEGAQTVVGGELAASRGYFVQPTVFAGVRGDMRVAREEIFGPVVSVLSFADEDEAVGLANGTDYSLAAAVWTNDVGRAHRMSDALNAGTVWINTYGPTDARLPWGGMGGQSGIGRDLGRTALDNYTEQKAIWFQRSG